MRGGSIHGLQYDVSQEIDVWQTPAFISSCFLADLYVMTKAYKYYNFVLDERVFLKQPLQANSRIVRELVCPKHVSQINLIKSLTREMVPKSLR